MNNLVYWVSVGLIVVTLALSGAIQTDRPRDQRRDAVSALVALVVGALGVFGSGWAGSGALDGVPWAGLAVPLFGAVAGIGLALFAAVVIATDSPLEPLLLAGTGYIVQKALGEAPSLDVRMLMGFWAGTAAGCVVSISRGGASRLGYLTLGGAVTLAVSWLEPSRRLDSTGPFLTPLLELVWLTVLTAGLVSVVAGRFARPERSGWVRVAMTALFGLATCVMAGRLANDPDAMVVVGCAVIVAMVCGYLTESENDTASWAPVLAGLLWVGTATLAFSFLRVPGIALAALTGLATHLLSGHRRAIAAMAPILALLLYRFGRAIYPDLSRGLELGQHYTLIGLLSGFLVPLALEGAVAPLASIAAKKRAFALVLLGIAGLATILGLVGFLGPKAAGGLLVGLGVSPLLATFARGSRPGLPSVAVALALFTIVCTGLHSGGTEPTRSDKAWLAGTVATVIVACAFAVVFFARQKKQVTE